MAWVCRPLKQRFIEYSIKKLQEEQTVDNRIFCRNIVHIHPRAFPAIHKVLAILLCALLTPPVSDPRLFSFRLALVLHGSRPLVVLVQRVEVLDVRLPVLLEIAHNGELARRRVLCRRHGRRGERRVVLVVVFKKKGRRWRCGKSVVCLQDGK